MVIQCVHHASTMAVVTGAFSILGIGDFTTTRMTSLSLTNSYNGRVQMQTFSLIPCLLHTTVDSITVPRTRSRLQSLNRPRKETKRSSSEYRCEMVEDGYFVKEPIKDSFAQHMYYIWKPVCRNILHELCST